MWSGHGIHGMRVKRLGMGFNVVRAWCTWDEGDKREEYVVGV